MTTFLGYFDQPNPGIAAAMEREMGIGFRAVRLNYGFNDENGQPKGGGSYLDREYDRIKAEHGYAPRGFWNMDIAAPYTFGSVAAGEADDVIRARAELIRDNPRWTKDTPLFVSPHHEQSVNNSEPNAQGEPSQPSGGEPKDYPGFFKRVHDVFQEVGILRKDGGSVMLTFVGVANQFKTPPPKAVAPWAADLIAPDPKLYQYAGCDIYSKPDYKRPDASDLDAVSAWAKKVGKKFIIGECGASSSDVAGKQAGWVNDVHTRLKSYGTKDVPGACNMVCWTFKDFPDGTSTRVDTDNEAMIAFQAMAMDPVFQRALTSAKPR